MNEEQASAIQTILGGKTALVGGNLWVVTFPQKDGTLVVMSEDCICRYGSELAFWEGVEAIGCMDFVTL